LKFFCQIKKTAEYKHLEWDANTHSTQIHQVVLQVDDICLCHTPGLYWKYCYWLQTILICLAGVCKQPFLEIREMCSKQTKIGRRIYRVAMAVTTDFLQE
jgi:hypothetical protein